MEGPDAVLGCRATRNRTGEIARRSPYRPSAGTGQKCDARTVVKFALGAMSAAGWGRSRPVEADGKMIREVQSRSRGSAGTVPPKPQGPKTRQLTHASLHWKADCLGSRCYSSSPCISQTSITVFSAICREFLGVDLFFVLSGFLITALLLRENKGSGGEVQKGLYQRRAFACFPHCSRFHRVRSTPIVTSHPSVVRNVVCRGLLLFELASGQAPALTG